MVVKKPKEIWNPLYVLLAFARPHTIIGTVLGVSCGSLTAVASLSYLSNPTYWLAVACILSATLLGNVYIVGLNQITDVEIDVINKPFLPIAAGQLSTKRAWEIVYIFGGLGLAVIAYGCLTLAEGDFVPFWLYFVGLFIGTIYSIPPIRNKERPIFAALSVMIVRGIILNGIILVFISRSLRIPLELNFFFVAFVLMMITFTTVIGVFKDIPDIEGDRMNKVWTLAVVYGPNVMVNSCIGVLTGAYVLFFIYGQFFKNFSSLSTSLSTFFLYWTHGLLGVILISKLVGFEYGNKKSVTSLYMFIWKLFYIEYVLFPIAILMS